MTLIFAVSMPYLCRIYTVFMPYTCIRRKYGIATGKNWDNFGIDENDMRIFREV